MKEKDINSLDHTTWRCQYHVVFAPKYRRMAIYREIKVTYDRNGRPAEASFMQYKVPTVWIWDA